MFYPLPSLGLSKKIQVVTPERSCRPACRSGTQAGSPVLRLFQISGIPRPRLRSLDPTWRAGDRMGPCHHIGRSGGPIEAFGNDIGLFYFLVNPKSFSSLFLSFEQNIRIPAVPSLR